ncbi:MAG: hypothetical protein ACLP9Y_28510 [Mycobacterium sp.]
MARNVFVVLTNPIADADQAFNEWYDTTHIPQVLDVPGVVAAQRYAISEVNVPDDQELPAVLPPPTHRYMVIYELDREPDQVMQEFLARVMKGKLALGEALDLSTISLTGWKPLGERRLAES